MTDHVELVEEVNGKSENVVLEAEIHRSFDMIQSAFDQSLAMMGESALKESRLKRNRDAREKGKLDGVIEEGKSLLSMVGDVADLAFTGVMGDDNAREVYGWVKGEAVGTLTERNATVQGTITGVSNVIDYTGDLVTGQKSRDQVKQDGASAAEAYAKPFMDLKGEDYRTMLTMTEQESHDAGLNDVGATMRVVDTAGAIFGGASLVKNGVKVLKGGGKKSGHGDGAKGGVPHGHGDGPDGSSGGVMKDGKLKTNAALMPSSLAELGERISQALGKMTAGAAASVLWRVRLMQSVDGRPFMVIVKKDNHMFSDTGGNRGKGSDSGNSKGSPNTSHVDSKESIVSSKDGTKARDGNAEGTGKDLLSPNGKFIDSKLESDYQKYLARKAKEGKPPRDRLEWKKARDYWLNDSPMARGNAFNKKSVVEEWYPCNEVHLSNGKRLDSYDPIKGEIVSRKATDLADIELSTFESYLKEMKIKYEPGTIIRTDKYADFKPPIDGQPLKGKQILEIPASNKNFSEIQDYIDLAKNKYGIEIRFREE